MVDLLALEHVSQVKIIEKSIFGLTAFIDGYNLLFTVSILLLTINSDNEIQSEGLLFAVQAKTDESNALK